MRNPQTFDSVAAWVKAAAVDIEIPVAGGGPPPARSRISSHDGFWVRGPTGLGFSTLYVFVPDDLAARDQSGLYQAGQASPECPPGQRDKS